MHTHNTIILYYYIEAGVILLKFIMVGFWYGVWLYEVEGAGPPPP